MKINSKKIVAFFILFAMLMLPINVFAINEEDYIWSSSIQTNANIDKSANTR